MVSSTFRNCHTQSSPKPTLMPPRIERSPIPFAIEISTKSSLPSSASGISAKTLSSFFHSGIRPSIFRASLRATAKDGFPDFVSAGAAAGVVAAGGAELVGAGVVGAGESAFTGSVVEGSSPRAAVGIDIATMIRPHATMPATCFLRHPIPRHTMSSISTLP